MYDFSSIPRKLYTIFQPILFPTKRYFLFKLLALSTDSVTKKMTVVHAVNFYNSGSIFATKKLVTESVLKVRSFMRDILASFDRENVGWKMVSNFLGNDEKTWINLYLLSLKTSVWKRSPTFFRAVCPNKNNVTTLPEPIRWYFFIIVKFSPYDCKTVNIHII